MQRLCATSKRGTRLLYEMHVDSCEYDDIQEVSRVTLRQAELVIIRCCSALASQAVKDETGTYNKTRINLNGRLVTQDLCDKTILMKDIEMS